MFQYLKWQKKQGETIVAMSKRKQGQDMKIMHVFLFVLYSFQCIAIQEKDHKLNSIVRLYACVYVCLNTHVCTCMCV